MTSGKNLSQNYHKKVLILYEKSHIVRPPYRLKIERHL